MEACMGTVLKYPDFLRQVFNVVLAEHAHEIDTRTSNEAREMVWMAENKYNFSSYEVEDPRKSLEEYFKSPEFKNLIRLLRRSENLLNDLVKRIKEYYGEELAELVQKVWEDVKRSANVEVE